MLPGVSSGAASITAGNGTPTLLIPAQSGHHFAGNNRIVNAGTQEASYSVDSNAGVGGTWITLSPGQKDYLPPGSYESGIYAKGNGGSAAGLSAVLWFGNVT